MYLVQYKQGLLIGSVSSLNVLASLGDQVEFLLMLVISIRYQAKKIIRIKVHYQFVGY